MANFIGERCISCREFFKEGDDIVVCPDCGTPYHRECYKEEGECINFSLHNKGETWKAERVVSFDYSDGELIGCLRCGEKNPKAGLFCKKCGHPINGSAKDETFSSVDSQRADFMGGSQNHTSGVSFFQDFTKKNDKSFGENAEIDKIRIREYKKYIGGNPIYFLAHFMKFAKTKSKVSFNLVAFLFPEYYYIYRKMYGFGILFLILQLLTLIPTVVVLSSSMGYDNTLFNFIGSLNLSEQVVNTFSAINDVVLYGYKILASLFANYIYFNKVKKSINEINSTDTTTEEKEFIMEKKGGTSLPLMFVAIGINSVITMALILL